MALGISILISLATAISGWLFGAFVVRRQMTGRVAAAILIPIATMFTVHISPWIGNPPVEAGWQIVLTVGAALYSFFTLFVSLPVAFVMERGWGDRAP